MPNMRFAVGLRRKSKDWNLQRTYTDILRRVDTIPGLSSCAHDTHRRWHHPTLYVNNIKKDTILDADMY